VEVDAILLGETLLTGVFIAFSWLFAKTLSCALNSSFYLCSWLFCSIRSPFSDCANIFYSSIRVFFSFSYSFISAVNYSMSTVLGRSMLVFVVILSIMAFLARLANCNVENVYAAAETDGDMQTISFSRPLPVSESLRILVNLEFLNGICVRDFSIKA
jgi:hypothetical protein